MTDSILYRILYSGLVLIVYFVICPPKQSTIQQYKTFIQACLGFACVGVLVLMLAGAVWYTKKHFTGQSGPNVILIGIDTLRADHLGYLGYTRNTSPNLDRLARESLVYERAHSTTSWTLPAFHSLMTGLSPKNHRVRTTNDALSPAYTTLAELVNNEGYQTAGFISAPYLEDTFGFEQGFDYYDESLSTGTNIGSHRNITSRRLTNKARFWLRNRSNSPFFLFLHYWDPHYDYIPPESYDRVFYPEYDGDVNGLNIERSNKIHPGMPEDDLRQIVSLYDGEIRWTDYQLGRLFDFLQKQGLYEESWIIVVGDHGDEFLEHGGKGHRHTLYQELIHVPLIIKRPGSREGRRISKNVSINDVFPTLVRQITGELPYPVDGKSLLTKDKNVSTKQRPIYATLTRDRGTLRTVRKGDWKLILDPADTLPQLYNVKEDPGESTNVFKQNPEVGKRMKHLLRNWKQSTTSRRGTDSRAKMSKETRRKLKGLGYLN
ncbi:MAG: sulfatase [bacterium]